VNRTARIGYSIMRYAMLVVFWCAVLWVAMQLIIRYVNIE
jgi:hypothetical protein